MEIFLRACPQFGPDGFRYEWLGRVRGDEGPNGGAVWNQKIEFFFLQNIEGKVDLNKTLESRGKL